MISLDEFFDTSLPVGFVADAPIGMADPVGLWKECVGSVLSQAAYPTLFARLGHRPAISGALTKLAALPSGHTPSSFRYMGGKLLMTTSTATANRVWVSTDNGATLTAFTGAGNSRICVDSLWDGTNYAVLNQDNSTSQVYLSYSPTGAAWTDVAMGMTAVPSCLINPAAAWYVAVINGAFISSASLTAGWASRTGNFATVNGWAYGAGVLVVVGSDSVAAKISCQATPTGNFTVCTVPVSGASSVAGIAIGAGKFVAWGYYTAGGSWVATSPDGINWTLRLVTAKTIYDMRYNGGYFVATLANTASLMVSADALSWGEIVSEQHFGTAPRLAFSANFGYVIPANTTPAYCGAFRDGASVSVQASLLQTTSADFAMANFKFELVPLAGGLVFAGNGGNVCSVADPYSPAANFQIPLRGIGAGNNRQQIKVR